MESWINTECGGFNNPLLLDARFSLRLIRLLADSRFGRDCGEPPTLFASLAPVH
jgi:hypothetical protein